MLSLRTRGAMLVYMLEAAIYPCRARADLKPVRPPARMHTFVPSKP